MGTYHKSPQKPRFSKRRKSQLKTKKRLESNWEVLKKLKEGYDNTIFSS